MLLSFCITCKNRLHQISKTLPQNLKDNQNKDIEFILVDFSSKDGLKEFVLNNFDKYLESKQLRYYYTDKLVHWHASIAKNTAHMLANGKYVVNLDCDNYIGKNGGDYLLDVFKKNGDDIVITQTQNVYGSGTAGRISLTKNNFIKLGGYNEYFYPMGYQDPDLYYRAIEYGLKPVHKNFNNNAIINTKDEAVKYTGYKIKYRKMYTINKLISQLNIKNNDLVANKCKNYIGLKILN